jgi:FixJ family two-component response regulator
VSEESIIAVIDDDESFRMALVESLRSLGYGVDDFTSAEDFLRSGDINSYGCVVTDIHMPGMSGLDLARQLMGRDPRVPLIMVTARTEPGLDGIAAANDVVCLLRKPFGSDTLTACIEKALGRDPQAGFDAHP